ncbi:hypothetical protein CMEL01_00804, partial [Colletotrichum melonis]
VLTRSELRWVSNCGSNPTIAERFCPLSVVPHSDLWAPPSANKWDSPSALPGSLALHVEPSWESPRTLLTSSYAHHQYLTLPATPAYLKVPIDLPYLRIQWTSLPCHYSRVAVTAAAGAVITAPVCHPAEVIKGES